MTDVDSSLPLAGCRVLDLTRLLPGNYCTLILALLGADVIKVEDRGRGDYIRSYGTQVEGASAIHHIVNRGKRSITLDLKDPLERAQLEDLVKESHVLIDSFRPGVMARLGLGPERLHELRPDLVIASISGFGADGPLAAHPGHDISYLAFSGLLDRIGLVGGAPVVPPVPLVDLLAGVFPAVGILAYRLRAERTGLGAVIDAPMVEAVSLLPSSLLADVLGGAVVPGRGEWRLGSGLATFAVYPAADGNVSVAAQEPQFWRNLCDVVGMSDLADRQRDPDAQSIIGARLTAFFGSRTRAEIEHAFEGRDACVTPVLSVEEMIVSDHAVAREYIDREGPHAVPVPELPFTVDGRRLRTDRPAPAQGADHQEIVRTEPK